MINPLSWAVDHIWFTEEERQQIDAHTVDNFVEVTYHDLVNRRERKGLYNRVTKELLWNDPQKILISKGLLILIAGIPLYVATNEMFHLMRIPFLSIKLIYTRFNEPLSQPLSCRAVLQEGKELAIALITIFKEQIVEMVRTPWYALGVELSIIARFYDGYGLRARVSLLERKWHYFESPKGSWQVTCDSSNTSFSEACDQTKVAYLAYCYQPWYADFQREVRTAPIRFRVVSPDEDLVFGAA